MGNQNKETPWQIWALVTIVVALIGAYATIESNRNKQTITPEIRIVDEREIDSPEKRKRQESTDNVNYDNSEDEVSPSQKLVGHWESNLTENGVEFTILLNLKSDGNSVYQFVDEHIKENDYDYGTWQYSNGVLYEKFSDGVSGKGRVKWISNDRFELTIIDNGTPSYTGLKRYYQRK
ncbi:hypothetical protein [Aquimarina macrocephali]|uniref:hypothetical protein n=1 Tax=Aquimarina macrocephali TaxID=666563 RepID=UPI003F66B5B4